MWSFETANLKAKLRMLTAIVLMVKQRAKRKASLLLVAMPFAPSSVLVPSSKARSY